MSELDIEPQATPRRAGRKVVREVSLTVGALAGLLCVTIAALALLFGVTPLVFRSGSMAPAIETGALALSKKTAATEVRVGDIVNVNNATGSRITHRVVEIGAVGTDSAELFLQGDANAQRDPEPYIASEVGRVVASVPKLGYAVSWLSGPVAVFAGGVLVGILLMVAWSPRKREKVGLQAGPEPASSRGRHSSAPLTVLLALGTVGALWFTADRTPTTLAQLNDTSIATSGTFTTVPLPPVPVPTNVGCQNQPGVLGLIGNYVTMSWTPPSGSGFTYRWTLTRSIQNGEPVRTDSLSGTSVDISNGLLLGTRTGTWVFTVQTVFGTRLSAPSGGFTLTMASTTSTLNLLPSVRCGSAGLAGAAARSAPQAVAPEATAPAPTVPSPVVPESTSAPDPTTTDPSPTRQSPAPPLVEVPPTTTTTTPPTLVDLAAPKTSPSGASTAKVVSVDGSPTLQIVGSDGAVKYTGPITSSDAYGYGVQWASGDQLWLLGPDQLIRFDNVDGSWSRTVVDPSATEGIPAEIAALVN